ncbi:uncharacterized protein N0V89_012414 [Didymosphaeria variabile]|uniref:FAD/NAD(P)-binding domain-containing protein n=1 Tax=Didymosphaeria variabile TaxID=1932322 RepID=A0A9W9C647_9PLEO|nr:uncharacterized protein N0V89_012414 [Didymosphaeria variabile]KAJ4344670.1 hypothetical protein N0V89_012414 [Didymosphaeria variabile]
MSEPVPVIGANIISTDYPPMISDYILLALQILRFLPKFAATILNQRISAFIHKRTYKTLPTDQLKNVVVIGGSFGGYQAVKRLTETLPTGYRVILVEKNSHLNYVFAFPRFSVVKGHEQDAFIPYTGLSKGASEGIFHHVQDTATQVTERFVELKSGEKLEYAYAVIATGTSSKLPSKVASTEKENARAELRGMQDKIQEARRIAIVGGGAVGVELASDTKDFYPEKEVTLIHSRAQLLNTFGPRLHNHVAKTLTDMDITLRLSERPNIASQSKILQFASGEEQEYDLIIPCTGQRPNSAIIAALSPASISKETSHVQVKPSLQILDDRFPQIFSLGDVAATGGPKMARAAFFQAEVVIGNIQKLIKGKPDLSVYRPNVAFEGSIKLTLGKTRLAFYSQGNNGREMLVPSNMGHEDGDVKKQWAFFGANAKELERTKESS